MYSILNIKEEKEKRREHFRKNFELFGAPVGIFVYIDRTMEHHNGQMLNVHTKYIIVSTGK